MLGFDALSAAPLSSVVAVSSPPVEPPAYSDTDIILWPVEATADIYLRDPALTETETPVVVERPGGGFAPRKPLRRDPKAKTRKRKKIEIPDDVGVAVEIWLDDEPVVALPAVAAPAVELAPEPPVAAPATVAATPTPRTRERITFTPRPRRPKPSRLRLERLRRQAQEEKILLALAALL